MRRSVRGKGPRSVREWLRLSTEITVTSVAAGGCTITVKDNHGQSVGEIVSVTTTGGTINGRERN